MSIVSLDGRDKFLIDINRKGTIKISKCTYQNRYRNDILLRLEIDGPPHTNPDGNIIKGTHLHICKEGYGDSWAYPLPDIFTNTKDLTTTLIQFLEYCKTINISDVMFQEGILQ